MPKHDTPLTLPAAFSSKVQAYFFDSDDRIELTDNRGLRRVKALTIWLILGGGGLAMTVGGIAWLMHIHAQPAPPRYPMSVQSDDEFLAILLIVLGGIMLVLLPVCLLASGLHRSFRVRVDFLERVCVCESRVFGLTVRRRQADFREADWEVDSVRREFAAQPESNGATVIVGVILFFMGPLGWIIGLLANSSGRKNRGRMISVEVARLKLTKSGQTIARILITNESAAEQFILAWDRRA